MGRTASGVIGIRLRKDDIVVGMVVIKRDATLLAVTENGYGKRSFIRDYRVTKRSGVGIITIKTVQKVGKMIALLEVVSEDDLMIITQKGVVIRLKIKGVSIIGRNTQGVRLIRLDEGDSIADVTRVAEPEEEEGNGLPDEQLKLPEININPEDENSEQTETKENE
jgi:DNA gyrase subunit A